MRGKTPMLSIFPEMVTAIFVSPRGMRSFVPMARVAHRREWVAVTKPRPFALHRTDQAKELRTLEHHRLGATLYLFDFLKKTDG